MDAGSVHFTNSSFVLMQRSVAFQDLHTYCVAPITSTKAPLASYDFWAVGVDCCSETAADFRCGEYNNPNAHVGLRVLNDEQRSFFRLAVQQAEARYAIKATHPLFFYWGENAAADTQALHDDAIKYMLIAMMAYFAFQLVCVLLAVLCLPKPERF